MGRNRVRRAELSGKFCSAVGQAGAIHRDNPAARHFLEFLATPEMAALFRRHGFELP